MRGESFAPSEVWLMGGVMLLAPFLSGIIMTALVRGRRGLRELFARMTETRVGVRWYLVLLVFPILILAVTAVLATTGWPELSPAFFAPGIAMGVLAGFLEETGWMGFAYPEMARGRSVLVATTCLGLIHAGWHFLADYMVQSSKFGQYWLPYFAGFFVFVFALRFLIVWVYTNTGSLLLAQLVHGFSTGFLAILVPIGVSPQSWAVFYPVYAVVLCLVVLMVIAAYGTRLVRTRTQQSTA
jgi:membrane protease YdiL (CAAX protease family)